MKEVPADGKRTTLALLTKAQVPTIQFINLEEEDDQRSLYSATATSTPVTSQPNITTASSSICYPESAVVLPAHVGSKTAPSKPRRGILWQPWSTSETSTTTTASVNEKAETSPFISSNGTEPLVVPSASVSTTPSQVQSVLEKHSKDKIIAPVKRSNPFPQQPNTAPKRHKSSNKESLFQGSLLIYLKI